MDVELQDLALEAEVALYLQVGGAFIEIDGQGYRRLLYTRQVTFEALDDWEPITHIATIVRGEVLLRPRSSPVVLRAGSTLNLTCNSIPFRQAGYIVGQWAIN